MLHDHSLLLLKDYSPSDLAFDSFIGSLFNCLDQNEVESLYLSYLKDTDLTASHFTRMRNLAYMYISSVLGHDPEPFCDF